MNWPAALVRASQNADRVIELAESLREELEELYATGDGESAHVVLHALAELFSEDTPVVNTLLDWTSLYLCSAVLLAGCISTECQIHRSAILAAMASRGPAREVFTGLTDGVSTLLETASLVELQGACPALLRSLSQCVLRIERKQKSFVGMTLQVIYRLSKRLVKDLDDLEAIADDVSLRAFLDAGLKLLQLGSDRMLALAFVVLTCHSLFSLWIWCEEMLKISLVHIQEEVASSLGSALEPLTESLLSFHDLLPRMVEAWETVDTTLAAPPTTEDRSRLRRELEQGCGLLMWASRCHASVPQLFRNEAIDAGMALLNADVTSSEAPCILAGLQLVAKACRSGLLPEAELEELCLKLLHHMEHHPHLQIKSRTAQSLSAILKSTPPDLQWAVLKEIVFVPCSDISALLVQHLRASVVAAQNLPCSRSPLRSSEVVKLLTFLLRETDTNAELLERAELYSAVLNLFLFLLIRHEVDVEQSVLDPQALEFLKVRVRSLEVHVQSLLIKDENALRLQPLQQTVEAILARIDK